MNKVFEKTYKNLNKNNTNKLGGIMKLFSKLFLLFLIISVIGCKSESDVLLTFKDGQITRGEFYSWLELRRFNKDKVIISKRDQESKLKMMGFDRVVAIEAKKAGLDKQETIKKFINISMDNLLAHTYINNKVVNNSSIKNVIARVSHINLRVKNFKMENKKRVPLTEKEMQKEKDAKIKVAKNIIKEYENGKSFEELAKKYSEDMTRNKKGDAGYVVEGLMPKEYTDAAFAISEGEIVKTPVSTNRGIYIIKLVEKLNISSADIETEIEDKNQAKRIKQKVKSKVIMDYLESLKKDKNVVFNKENAKQLKGESVIFKISDEVFKVSDLNKKIDLYNSRYAKSNRKPKQLTEQQRQMFSKQIFELALIKKDAVKNNFDKDEKYTSKKHLISDMMLAREFLKKNKSNNVEITEKMIKDEYNKNKNKTYVKTIKTKKGTKKVPQKYSDVKERIKRMLTSRKNNELTRKWREGIKKKYSLAVNKSKLEGK